MGQHARDDHVFHLGQRLMLMGEGGAVWTRVLEIRGETLGLVADDDGAMMGWHDESAVLTEEEVDAVLRASGAVRPS